jgi:CDP-diglyceride synthetase
MLKQLALWRKAALGFFLGCGPLAAFVMAIYQLFGSEGQRATFVLNCLLVSGSTSLFVAWLGMALYLWQRRHESFEKTKIALDSLGAFLLLSGGGSFFIASGLIPDFMLWVLFSVCLNDIAAYFVGKSIGRHQIARVLSPKKTVAGSVGGLVVGVLVSYIVCECLRILGVGLNIPFHNSSVLFFLATLLLVFGSQVGDIAESYLKRYHDCKDSGGLLPGHGGIYDRLDATLGGMCVLLPVFVLNYLMG